MPYSPKPFLPSGYMVNSAFLPTGYTLEEWQKKLRNARYINGPVADLFKSAAVLPGVRVRGAFVSAQGPQWMPRGARIPGQPLPATKARKINAHLSGMADDVFSQVKGLYEKDPAVFQVGAAVLAGIALFAFLPGGKR